MLDLQIELTVNLRNRRALREQIIRMLREADFPALVELAATEPGVGDMLLQFLYDPQDLLHWRALEGLGHLAGAQPEQVRKLISRLLWLLNEDSGSFGWGAAAALGEIGRGNIALVKDIISDVLRLPGGGVLPGAHALGHRPAGGDSTRTG